MIRMGDGKTLLYTHQHFKAIASALLNHAHTLNYPTATDNLAVFDTLALATIKASDSVKNPLKRARRRKQHPFGFHYRGHFLKLRVKRGDHGIAIFGAECFPHRFRFKRD